MKAMVFEGHTGDSQPGDDRLVQAFLAGDEGAFDALVHRYRVLVYQVARSVVRNHQDADDVAQDAFLKAYRNLGGFRGEASFKTWLLRIVTHTALNHRRSWWVRRRSATEDAHLETLPEPGGQEEHLLEAERLDRMRAAIQALPDRQRETVERRLQGGEKYAGIAREMGVSVGTVKANFHHAVRNLRQTMEEGSDPEPNG